MSWSVNAKNGATTLLSVGLFVTDCPDCGILHGIPEEFKDRKAEGGGTIYCPNGHKWHFTELEVTKQRKRAEQAESALRMTRISRDAARDQAQAAHRSASAYKGVATKMRNRIADGVCPVPGCRRNFANVKAHITGQHPQWAHEHPEVLV
jgi:uncharacterized Zn finger protein (UPF0148 family)